MGRRRKFTDTEKWCPRCKSWKPNSEFGVLATNESGLYHYCLKCVTLNTADRAEKKKVYQRQYSYGLTPERYKELYEKQNGKCAMPGCSRPPTCVDHDHETDEVRALLCKACNTGLGIFKDDPKRLREAAEYIESFREKL